MTEGNRQALALSPIRFKFHDGSLELT